jgi:hypothetical protein
MTKCCAIVFAFVLLAACSKAPQETAKAPEPSTATTEPPPSTTPQAVTDRTSFNGVWELVSFDQNEPDGNISHPYGEMPIGRLTFDAANRMSVFVMKPGRVASVNTTAQIPTASTEDLRQIADGFMAYYGDFRLDETNKTLITEVEACTIPAWSGTEQKRTYELMGDTLALITPATKLTWKRLPN